MINISYFSVVIAISIVWIFIRVLFFIKSKEFVLKRELELLLVYVCIIVIARFTFFPFGTVNGKIQPLIFDTAQIFPFRTNLIPFVNLFDYPSAKDIVINVLGNIAMFIPLGIVWPIVYKKLDTPARAILTGVGVSLSIEILQLPFYTRVSDVDDLILNSLGYIIGYGLLMIIKKVKEKRSI